jgi:phosphoglycerol transferase MdoB-like AlkP superfamily enzyme
MTPRNLYTGTGFLVAFSYLALGALTQSILGSLGWTEVPSALLLSLVVAVMVAAIVFWAAGKLEAASSRVAHDGAVPKLSRGVLITRLRLWVGVLALACLWCARATRRLHAHAEA